MRTFPRCIALKLTLCAIVLLSPLGAVAQTPVASVPSPCGPRFAAGSVIHEAPALHSRAGLLDVQFSFQQTTDTQGRLLHCLMTPDGLQEPTLHVRPGDRLRITVTNNTPTQPFGEAFDPPNCGDTQVQFPPGTSTMPNPNGILSIGSSMNIHYHGTNVTPACGGDNVTKTLINSGSTFVYDFTFPTNEPPGLYWYHPHVHGLAERDLLGGATGALVVDGIEDIQPAVEELRQRILVIRDQPQYSGLGESAGNCGNGVPFQDLSVNYVSIDSYLKPNDPTVYFTPAVLKMAPGETEFWRVTNSAADTILDLQVLYDGVPQTLQIVGIDAVPVNSQDGTGPGQLVRVTRYRLPVAGRVEFLVKAPDPSVQVAQLVTNNINTGPQGDCDPTRPIFNIALASDDEVARKTDDARAEIAPTANRVGPHSTAHQRFAGLGTAPVVNTRVFQFSEQQPTQFFITEVSVNGVPTGAPLHVFDNNQLPAVTVKQGTVEKWIIQNIAQENHEFHMHQIHFKVKSQDYFDINGTPPAPGIQDQYMDMIEVPFWDNVKNPNGPVPQVELRMDFRGMDVGDFVYHCHILSHEDLGMMAIIRVEP